ncbi:RNA polymerase sigma factor [Pedobacter heparinus]|uniref:RNA polymerase sigma factor n=1 Tax=Pedobacter heparinus TaxID=984 RepID=UPI00292D817A|nr:sigma-70 family RNA polymerase sigma factor [Pedobacter heparinus]
MSAYSPYTDQELTALLKAGDEFAFTEVYNKYWDKLFFVAAKKLNDEAEAEEAVQDIFLALWKNREHFVLKESFEHYFAVAVKFQVIKRRDKRSRHAAIEQIISTQTEAEFLQSQARDWTQEHLEKLQTRLDLAIDTLPKKCRLVFKMSRDEDYTNKKIATELGITEKAVEKHVTTALKVLKNKLGPNAMLLAIINELL